MSSVPFKLGISVVNQIPAETGEYIVRAKDHVDFYAKVIDVLDRLTDKDVLKGYCIGFRPDHPIPNAKYFAEVSVRIGEAEDWMFRTVIDLYHFSVVGNRKTQEKE